MNPSNLIGLTIFLRDGHFIMFPTSVEVANRVIDDWAAGKYADQPCPKCRGSGKAPGLLPGSVVDAACPECRGDGKTYVFFKGTCPFGPIPRYAIKMADVKMMHTRIIDQATLQQMVMEMQQYLSVVAGGGWSPNQVPGNASG